MKFKLIYPKWKKLDRQTEFHLPPHGPVVFAATLPPYVEVEFVDENVQRLELDDAPDFVGISMMLTAQVRRGWQIADHYRSRGIKVHLRRHCRHAPCAGNDGACRCGVSGRGRRQDGSGV